MEFEFMTAGTPLPPCMPLPPVLLRLPASSTAKVMYARMLDEALAYGIEDENGILYIHFPIKELAAALSRSTMTIKRAMSELDDMAKNKTRIDVIAVFDGELDATDVFVSLIAQKHSQKSSEESGKNNLAKTQDLCYTKDKVQVTGVPSGLCG